MALVQMLFRWLRYPITLWIILLLPLVLPETIYRVDPLALLSATLRTYQRAGCDTDQISLSCPRGTSISIELAQYGRAGDITDNSLCPPAPEDDSTTMLEDVVHSGTEIEVKPSESCSWPNALQYALLQTVVDACQKKRHCKFTAPSKSLTGDPCPGVRKFVEVAYKCRPYEFRSKVGCENDMIQLMCNPYSRIAIYGASFGRTEYENVQCAQPQGVKEETCLASYATETVMQICHGRRRCSLSADAGTFGKPCHSDSRQYLKVVYTCIPRRVLKDRYDTSPEPDEPQQNDFEGDQDNFYDEDQFYKESEAIPPAPKLQSGLLNPSNPFDYPLGESSSSVIPPLLSRNDNSLEENQERFYLYLIVSVAAGVVLCLILVVGRLIVHKRRRTKADSKFQQTGTAGETQLPNGFSDDISEIDADIDLTTPLPVPSVARNETYMTYTPSPSPYGGSLAPSSVSHTSTTMLVPTNSLIVSGGSSMGGGGGSRQPTPPPPNLLQGGPIATYMGPPPVSGPMGPLMPISSVSHHTTAPSYLPGALMVSHHGTLRRTMVPAGSGMMPSPSPTPPPTSLGVVTTNMCYDASLPRNLGRGLPPDNAQYYYG